MYISRKAKKAEILNELKEFSQRKVDRIFSRKRNLKGASETQIEGRSSRCNF